MWFTENAWPPMIVAAIAAMIFFAIWNIDRRNLYFYLAITCLCAMVGFYVVERSIVTEGEKLQLDIAELCDQFRKNDDKVLDHFSEHATEFRLMCKTAMELVEIGDDLNLTDFQTTITNNNSRADVHFRANGTITYMNYTAHHPFRCIMTYQKEGGAWKIVDVQRLDPFKGDKMEIMARR